MSDFRIINDKSCDLTQIIFSGNITGDSIINAAKAFYGSEITTKVLWDFSNCNVTALTAGDLTRFIEISKPSAYRRANGKSALVGPSDVAFGLGRMITSLFTLYNYPVHREIFRTIEEAMEWLDS